MACASSGKGRPSEKKADENNTTDQDRIKGLWKAVSVEEGGGKGPPPEEIAKITIQFADGKVTMLSPTGELRGEIEAGKPWTAPPARRTQETFGGGSEVLTVYTPGMIPDVWKPGMAAWVAADTVTELQGLLASVPPPLPS